jgi:hypothetical protein
MDVSKSSLHQIVHKSCQISEMCNLGAITQRGGCFMDKKGQIVGEEHRSCDAELWGVIRWQDPVIVL